MGSIDFDDIFVQDMVVAVGCAVVAVEWRHAPEHPYPASLADCYDGLVWLTENAPKIGIDPKRLALGGASSGGGSAAGLALLVRDRAEPSVCFQMLLYPMLDDRNCTPSSQRVTDARVWNRDCNVRAWAHYLRDIEGAVPAYAAPSRAEDLQGLPPAFIAVGACDLFVDEDIDYAKRLLQADVPTELHVYPGGPHGLNRLAPEATISKQLIADRNRALRRGLGLHGC